MHGGIFYLIDIKNNNTSIENKENQIKSIDVSNFNTENVITMYMDA